MGVDVVSKKVCRAVFAKSFRSCRPRHCVLAVEVLVLLTALGVLALWSYADAQRSDSAASSTVRVRWTEKLNERNVLVEFVYDPPRQSVWGHNGAYRLEIIPFHAAEWPEAHGLLNEIRGRLSGGTIDQGGLEFNSPVVLESDGYLRLVAMVFLANSILLWCSVAVVLQVIYILYKRQRNKARAETHVSPATGP